MVNRKALVACRHYCQKHKGQGLFAVQQVQENNTLNLRGITPARQSDMQHSYRPAVLYSVNDQPLPLLALNAAIGQVIKTAMWACFTNLWFC